MSDAQARLRERSPFGLLAMASGLVEVATPRPLDEVSRKRAERPDARSTFESFASSEWPAMRALAAAVITLHPDEVLAMRIRNLIGLSALDGMPRWLSSMGEISIDAVRRHSDPLGDGENVAISWSWPDGEQATVIAYIDHNMGTIVKDAFAIPDGAVAITELYARMDDRHMEISELDPADARERIVMAIEAGERMLPPCETETWPTCRPMLEWVVGHLPEGGTGFERPQWSEADRQRLIDAFAGSKFAAVDGLDDEQARSLADPLVSFACDYGPGDPLRWSAVSVEIVLADWYPRKVFGVAERELQRLPDVLEAFVEYCHDRQQIAPDLTADTLESIDEWRAEFEQAISRPGRSPAANAARLARIAAGLDPDAFDDDELDDDELDDDVSGYVDDEIAYMSTLTDELEATVIDLVGGRQAYDELDDAPLGDVEFDWARIPADLRQPTAATLEFLDQWSIELYDAEVRTIARSVLAGVVAADPAVFKRSNRTDALAAGILSFLMLRLTGRFSTTERRALPWKVTTQKALATATGVTASTISGRTKTIANVVERASIDWPANLHSTQRQEALRTRRIVAEWRHDHPPSRP